MFCSANLPPLLFGEAVVTALSSLPDCPNHIPSAEPRHRRAAWSGIGRRIQSTTTKQFTIISKA
jgi:hypothetical protein